MSKILVTGGTGYIGSHTIVDLIENGFDVVSVDNHINSDDSPLQSIEQITGKKVPHYAYDLCDLEKTKSIFEAHPDIEGVIHFAALKAVGDSVKDPILYFRNNLNSLINILDCCRIHEVNKFIFSSSCTVYGNAETLPVSESSPENEAESPYGRTKQVGEKIIKDSIASTAIQCISLRYFNPAGAHTSTLLGESPINPPQNLVPVITETAMGRRASMTVFGNSYDTRDGSCIRDYIHVMDLANAHTKALQALSSSDTSSFEVYNLGIGEGVSVLEAIQSFESVTGLKLNYKLGERREGDVVAIYADYTKAREQLGWIPKLGIDDIMRTAWAWEQKRSTS